MRTDETLTLDTGNTINTGEMKWPQLDTLRCKTVGHKRKEILKSGKKNNNTDYQQIAVI